MKTNTLFICALTGFARFSTIRLKVAEKILIAVLFLAVMATQVQAQGSYALTSLFTVPTGTGNIANSSANRGMAYDSVSNLVYVANTAPSIGAFNGISGAYLGAFNVTGVTVPSETLHLDQIGVAGDGAIYGINLSLSSTVKNQIYRWTNWLSTPYVSFSGNALVNGGSLPLTSARIGDTMAVTGSGTNTLILTGVGGTNVFCLYYTTNGVDFTNTIINVPNLPFKGGVNVYGLCFYTNNTFLIKPYSSGSNVVYLVQYPANFASQNLVTGVMLTNTSLGGSYNNTTMLSYSPGGFLGVLTTGGSPSPVGLFSATNIAGGVSSLATASPSTPNSNGNATGAAALGGNGLTNALYVLDTANSLIAYNIVFSSAPLISGFSGGITNVFPPQTLTVTASGSAPLYYNWYNISGGVTNAFVNNTNFYTVTTGGTNLYYVIVTNASGSATSSVVGVALNFPVTNSAVSLLWRVPALTAGYSYLDTSGNTRGLGYDTNSQRLVIANNAGSIYILDANSGANLGNLDMSTADLSGGTFALDQVVIADDGAVYSGNLAVDNSKTFKVNRWAAPSNSVTATVAYDDSGPGTMKTGDRWGDNMAVRGSGPNTQILLAARNGTNVALLTPNDGIGVTYSAEIIAISGVPGGFAGLGIAFGDGNTFWGKTSAGDLRKVSFDPVLQTGSVIFDYTTPGQIPSSMVGLGVDPVRNILAGIITTDTPHDMQLFQLTGTADAPVMFYQGFFTTANVNGNGSMAIAMKYPRVYGLDAVNGLVALTYGVPPTAPPIVTAPPASRTVYTNIPSVIFGVSVSGSLPIYYQWRFNGNNIANATNSTYTLTTPPLSKAGNYDVVVHNIVGSVTSTPPALLTLIAPVTSVVVTQLWTLPAGSLGFLDGSTYNTRGLAYDTNSAQVVVADHANIHLLAATNGSYLGDLNVAGVFNGGLNGWLFNQIGIADDGTLYAGNLTLTGTGFSLVTWSPGYGAGSFAVGYAYGGGTGGDPGSGSGERWGDTIDVRGSGVNTEILIGSYTGTNAVLFTTTDGSSFTANLITVTNVPAGFGGQGIAFGAGDTFWTKSPGYNLRQVAFDRTTSPWTGGAIKSFTSGTQTPSAFDGIGVDVAAGVLGGVNYSDTPNDLQLYLLSGNSNPPSLVDQAFFGSVNANSQFNAVTTLKGGLGFSLNVNNGITAISYGAPSAPAVTITSVGYAPGAVTLNWNNTFNNHGYQVQFKNHLLDPLWTNVGLPVTNNAPTASYMDTSATGTTRFYRVISQ
ncbi:MAG TPA: hypothetical protein VK815_07620 [Candidatus Acidoferrales bacterium]|jgi:hypothetical protein|nr:hypothetical protein [Candidatus Acidoferrales bacterium]